MMFNFENRSTAADAMPLATKTSQARGTLRETSLHDVSPCATVNVNMIVNSYMSILTAFVVRVTIRVCM